MRIGRKREVEKDKNENKIKRAELLRNILKDHSEYHSREELYMNLPSLPRTPAPNGNIQAARGIIQPSSFSYVRIFHSH